MNEGSKTPDDEQRERGEIPEEGYNVLICTDCGREFILTNAARQYMAEIGYTEDPRVCSFCYLQRKAAQIDKNSDA